MEHTAIAAAAEVNCQLAENPLWHSEEKCLYWTDIPKGKIYRLDYLTQRVRTIYSGEPVGGFTLQENGDLLLFRVKDIALLGRSSHVTTLRTFSDEGMHRFNDVIADPLGRVFAGTIGENPKAGLYRIDLDGTITKQFAGTGCSNGMGFSTNQKKFYWTCSTQRKIFEFDYDAESGELRNRRTFYTASSSEGIPDGLTVDMEDCIWSARWGGSALIRHAPDGKQIARINFPAVNITSMCFGGPALDELFVTCAQEEGKDSVAFQSLFRAFSSIPFRGKSEFKSKIAKSNGKHET